MASMRPYDIENAALKSNTFIVNLKIKKYESFLVVDLPGQDQGNKQQQQKQSHGNRKNGCDHDHCTRPSSISTTKTAWTLCCRNKTEKSYD